jgi:hypothetical protein
MSGMEWADMRPVLAGRVAADTGHDVAEVEAFLEECYQAEPADVDIDRLVELIAPTMATIIGPTLLDVLARLERLTRAEKLPVLAPIALGILPGIVQAIVADEMRGRRRGE